MKSHRLNKYGQPFSKAAKKASRLMMKMRRGFELSRSSSGSISMPAPGMIDAMATAAMALLSFMRVGRYRR